MRGSCPSTVERGFVVCAMVSDLVLSIFLMRHEGVVTIVTLQETTPLGVVFSIGNLDDYELRKGPGNNRSNDGPSETFKHLFCFLSCFATLRVRQYAQGV